jgi:hypothetical protein
MEYSIKIQELVKRPIIRSDFNEEWMNKMTDEEFYHLDKEIYDVCIKDGTSEKYPDINDAYLSKHIDIGILYNLFKMSV